MPIPTQFGATGTDGNGSAADTITPVEGGHVHSDGTFHADAPAAGRSRGAAARSPPASRRALAAAARRGELQYQHGEQVAAQARRRGAKPSRRRSDGPKLGRNDPCWCGSGKKYKRCHGA